MLFRHVARYCQETARNLVCRQFTTSAALHKLEVGQSASATRVFTAEDLRKFADVTHDTNPIHLDKEYAKKTKFKQPVVHGVLVFGLLSSVIGTRLPGPGTIVLSYSVEHPTPLYLNEEVTASVTVKEIEGRKACIDMMCVNPVGEAVLQGECIVFIPKHSLK